MESPNPNNDTSAEFSLKRKIYFTKSEVPPKRKKSSEHENDTSSEESKSLFIDCDRTSGNKFSDANSSLPGPSKSATTVDSNKQKLDMLLEFCMPKLRFSVQEETKLKEKMHHKFEVACETYTGRLEFSNYLDTIWQKVDKPSSIIPNLIDLKRQLKAHKKKKITLNTSNRESSKLPVNSVNIIGDFPTTVASVSEVTEDSLRYHNLADVSSGASNSRKVKLAKSKLENRIERLEKYLGQLDKQIKKLQATELSMDDLDDEDSVYIREEKYKKRFNKTWALLCRFKNRSTRVGREIEKHFRYEGTRWAKLNAAVEKFIDKRKASEKFPNYVDTYDLIKKTNEASHLGLSESDYSELAKKIFQDIGQELKKRRKIDVDRDFGCFLTDEVKLEEDPAEKDLELKTKLETSVAEGEKKLDELIEKFAVRQETEVDAEVEEDVSDVSLEPEYPEPNDDQNDDLPDTAPATSENRCEHQSVADEDDFVRYSGKFWKINGILHKEPKTVKLSFKRCDSSQLNVATHKLPKMRNKPKIKSSESKDTADGYKLENESSKDYSLLEDSDGSLSDYDHSRKQKKRDVYFECLLRRAALALKKDNANLKSFMKIMHNKSMENKCSVHESIQLSLILHGHPKLLEDVLIYVVDDGIDYNYCHYMYLQKIVTFLNKLLTFIPDADILVDLFSNFEAEEYVSAKEALKGLRPLVKTNKEMKLQLHKLSS